MSQPRNCPSCDASIDNTRTIKTINNQRYTRRIKTCVLCKADWETVEISRSDFNRIAELESKIVSLEQLIVIGTAALEQAHKVRLGESFESTLRRFIHEAINGTR